MKTYIKTALLCSLLPFHIWAQEGVTNAFEDLQRTGVVAEESSVMRDFASSSEVASLLKSLPASGFFCFAEDRMHDIRVYDSIPRRWLQKDPSLRNVV
ncbi:MAG: glycoside hydrolase domain-containing protein, partial [Tannerellaceae bacterium]